LNPLIIKSCEHVSFFAISFVSQNTVPSNNEVSAIIKYLAERLNANNSDASTRQISATRFFA
jgi:hypothetical protein